MKFVFAALLFLSSLAPVIAHADDGVYAPDRIANKGYDIVAYFSLETGEDAVQGVEEFKATHDGYVYYFSSADNRDAFEKDKEKYLPAYGGYCAYAVAENEQKVKIDPNVWSIVDGTLYLNYNNAVQKKWETRRDDYIAKANIVWENIKDDKFNTGWF